MIQYHEIELRGLTGSNPLGAMAAFGLLRICTSVCEDDTPELFWKIGDDWYAVLKVRNTFTNDDLISAIGTYLDQRSATFYDDISKITMETEKFRAKAVQLINSASVEKRVEVDYWAAFGSEMVTDESQGNMKPTEFDMSSGNQRFFDKMRNAMKKIGKDEIREALFMQWKYNDSHEYAMGWDPATERIHALRNKEPSKDDNPLCEAAAEWLGFESLPLFPTTVRGDKLLTVGFFESKFTWPIWEQPVALDTLRTMLASAELQISKRNSQKLRLRGVSAVYSSMRMKFGRNYGILRPPEMLWSK